MSSHGAYGPLDKLTTGSLPTDAGFDRLLPQDLRMASATFWTPCRVALVTARWMNELGIQSLVDIGSGVGKLCIVAALATRATFVGIEYRSRLIGVATTLARDLGVDGRVRFIAGAFGEMHVPPAEAYYFFNPFAENTIGPGGQLDHDVALAPERRRRDIANAQYLLEQAPAGTFVITYGGMGGALPRAFRDLRSERNLPTTLRLYRKVLGLVARGTRVGR
jgi:hypothetical protein